MIGSIRALPGKVALVVLFLLAGSGAVFARSGVFENQTSANIYQLTCLTAYETQIPILEYVAVGARADLSDDNFRDCEKILLNQGWGEIYQFFLHEGNRNADRYALHRNPSQPDNLPTFPSLEVQGGIDGLEIIPAGLPFAYLAQAMAFGIEEFEFSILLTSHWDAYADPRHFAVALGGYSWDIMPWDGAISYYDDQLASINLGSEFISDAFPDILAALRDAGAEPTYLFAVLDERTEDFYFGGGQSAKTQPGSGWDALYSRLSSALDGYPAIIQIRLAGAGLEYEMNIDRQLGRVHLSVSRQGMGPVG